jgi:release factor glutamine methyltransferase
VRAIPGLKGEVSVEEAVRLIARAFEAAGIDEPFVDARALVGHALHLDRARLLGQSDRVLETREIDAVSALAARRLAREPVARILGRKEFWNQVLQVTPAVLVPRPETETVVEAALDVVDRRGLRAQALRILDIGTGSGALLLALVGELPHAHGTGTDISAEAIAVARGNAERNGLSARCTFVECDMSKGVAGTFDLIVSNPPYSPRGGIEALAPEVRDHDPRLALDGGIDGLEAYRAIAADVGRLLAPAGALVVELGMGQEAAVTALLAGAGLSVAPARKDLAGIPRALAAARTA